MCSFPRTRVTFKYVAPFSFHFTLISQNFLKYINRWPECVCTLHSRLLSLACSHQRNWLKISRCSCDNNMINNSEHSFGAHTALTVDYTRQCSCIRYQHDVGQICTCLHTGWGVLYIYMYMDDDRPPWTLNILLSVRCFRRTTQNSSSVSIKTY